MHLRLVFCVPLGSKAWCLSILDILPPLCLKYLFLLYCLFCSLCIQITYTFYHLVLPYSSWSSSLVCVLVCFVIVFPSLCFHGLSFMFTSIHILMSGMLMSELHLSAHLGI
jgi:hypothetical protein